MTDLTTTDPGSLHAIAARAEHACIVFPEHRLPEGCRPDHADVGIESHSGRFLLHVRAGTTYDGSDVAVAQWVRIGTRSFPSMDDCIAWLRGRLAETTDQPTARRTLSMAPNELTDITQVQVGPTRITADDLERALRRDVLGQDDAVRGLSELAATHLARVRPRRPASALFVGPTGSGKTLAAEALAEQLRASTGVPWVTRGSI